jgi:hypothetical protein
MTDRLKGVLVTFDREIRDDDAEPLLAAIAMIKGVRRVKPYVCGMEDYMTYERGYQDAQRKMLDHLRQEPKNPTT